MMLSRTKGRWRAAVTAARSMPCLQGLDPSLIAPVIALHIIGIVSVFWAGISPRFSDPLTLVRDKLVFSVPAILVAFAFASVDYHLYERRGFQAAISSVITLSLIALFFSESGEGNHMRLLFLSRTIQPAEYAKVIAVMVLSYTILETYRRSLLRYFFLSIHSILLGVLFVLIGLQPDFGAVLIMLATAVSMLTVARMHPRGTLSAIAIFVLFCTGLIFGLAFAFHEDFYVLNRFRIFLQCFFVSGCDAYQMNSAYMALASGGFFGNGIMGSIHSHGILPMECNDFIFCVIAERTGLLGVALLLSMYALFVHRGLTVAKHCRDYFGQLMAFGLTWAIGFQVLLNISVATGLFPVTGVTLPFISQGGNSLLSTMAAAGMLMNVSKHTVGVSR